MGLAYPRYLRSLVLVVCGVSALTSVSCMKDGTVAGNPMDPLMGMNSRDAGTTSDNGTPVTDQDAGQIPGLPEDAGTHPTDASFG